MRILPIIVLFLGLGPAFAHDPEHPALNDWYQSLRSNSGSPCCDGSEFNTGTAAHIETEDWETQDKANSHFKVRLDGKWQDVPDSAVVNVPNKDGRALVWFYVSRGTFGGQDTKVIRCFMPGTMS